MAMAGRHCLFCALWAPDPGTFGNCRNVIQEKKRANAPTGIERRQSDYDMLKECERSRCIKNERRRAQES